MRCRGRPLSRGRGQGRVECACARGGLFTCSEGRTAGLFAAAARERSPSCGGASHGEFCVARKPPDPGRSGFNEESPTALFWPGRWCGGPLCDPSPPVPRGGGPRATPASTLSFLDARVPQAWWAGAGNLDACGCPPASAGPSWVCDLEKAWPQVKLTFIVS